MLAALRRGLRLLAAAGRRGSEARLPAGRHTAQGRRGAGWGARPGRGRGGPSPGGVLAALAAFSLFSKNTEEGEEKKEEESAGTEDTIIFLLKKAKLSIMKGEHEEAERILHQALRLSHQSDNKKAIIYTYDLMANLAFLRGQLDSAEKLFKAAMSFLLAGDMKQDDNAIIEMSLKLASIYAAQNQHKLALAGYEFCILTLEEKLAQYKDLPEDVLPEERANTNLLLGMSLDSYGRYLLANKQLLVAQRMYERALQISREVQGETHPQTVVLMNDLATVLDAQGLYDDAYTHGKRACELAKQTEHPEEHLVLNNLAGILMHKEDFLQAKQMYKEALKQAELKGDTASIQHIREELAELARRRKHSN
ncbi:tetratricopeptide repeat protein 19, mitochondrial isoform X2 [Emydura macquarii macquarii]|uniref:tetratricopeptide repeat protein 19, mitochondrial isoform X2 n=1 Tax=Emydura macquarii macquarii TaxID=1129001 RepID=UPI00352AB678